MRWNYLLRLLIRTLTVTCLLSLLPPTGMVAQTTTGSIRGFVRDELGQPLAGVNVVATNPATNFQRSALTGQNGFFNISGLPPAAYQVRFSLLGRQAESREVRVATGATLNLDATLTSQAIELEGITATAERVIETETPEIATNVTQEQIENIPIPDRNFLTLALLAPGVRSTGNSISSGGVGANSLNVFIDGVSFKNDILTGGAVGQDASRGNPFPQDAVQEFRVITQQYKAEYQKATGALVTATTKSGTNQWDGNLFLFGQTQGLIQQDYFTVQRCDEGRAEDPNFVCAPKPDLEKWQGGASLGGPIIRDKLWVFGSYEGNHQDRSNTVLVRSTEGLPADLAVQLRNFEGTFTAPVRSDLYFGKLTYTPADRHRLELSASIRDEYEIRNFGGTTAYETAEHFNNDVNTFLLKHQYSQAALLNEASVSFQRFHWLPIPLTQDKINLVYSGVLEVGGRCCMQDFTQDRLSFRDDVSYTLSGLGGDHVFKVGANLDFLNYDVFRTNFGNPRFVFNASNDFAFPVQAQAGFGDPGIYADNRQFGVYAQDDWSVSPKLILNLGVRWDYESNMLNNDYVTPDSIIRAVRAYAATLPCGEQSSDPAVRARQLLCDVDRFVTNGEDRPPFMGAIQPRLGFSYDLFGNGRTTLFGGFGVYYDRNRFGNALGEIERIRYRTYTFRFSETGEPQGSNPTIAWDPRYLSREGLQALLASGNAPKPELFLIENETRPPRANHFSVGARQAIGDVLLSGNYTGVRGDNVFTWFRVNRNPNGTCCQQTDLFSNMFVSSDDARTWYDALMFKAEKRFSDRSPWGAQLAYTLAWTEENADPDGVFSALNVFTPETFVRYPASNDERHHIILNWIFGLPWDLRFGGIIDLGSGNPYNATIGFGPGTNNCTHGNQDCLSGNDWPEGEGRNWWRPEKHSFIIPNAWAFRNVDLRLEKRFNTFRGQEIGVIAEVFNVFDYANFTSYDLQYGLFQSNGTVSLNENFGEPRGVVTDLRAFGAPRRFQLGVRYQF